MQIPAVDVKESAAFYVKVFGWTSRGGSSSHFGFSDSTGDMIGAFVTNRSIPREAGVLLHVYVHGIDRVLSEIVGSGGTLVREPYPEGDLWVATFRDPAGNLMGVCQRGPP